MLKLEDKFLLLQPYLSLLFITRLISIFKYCCNWIKYAPNLRSNSRNLPTPLPVSPLIYVSAVIAAEEGNTTESPEVPTIQSSGLRGLQLRRLQENPQVQVEYDQDNCTKCKLR